MAKGGLFKPPRWKYLSKIVSFESPSKARKASKQLLREIRDSKRKDAALRRARALQYAANRAKASLNRENLSPRERSELKRIAKIYDEAAEKAWEIYGKKFKK